MAIIIKIPTKLRSLTKGEEEVTVEGKSIKEVIDNLETNYNGLKERLCDENGQIRKFINFYLNDEDVRFINDEDTEIRDGDEITIELGSYSIKVSAIEGGQEIEHLKTGVIPEEMHGKVVIAIFLQNEKEPDQTLSPEYLTNKILPYVNDVMSFQHAIDKIAGRRYRKAKIISITQKSPIKVEIVGVPDALKWISEIIIPSKRKHAQNMARLKEERYEITNELIRARVTEKRANVDSVRIGNERAQIELCNYLVDLALDIVDKIAPQHSVNEKIDDVEKLLPIIRALISSEVQPAVYKRK